MWYLWVASRKQCKLNWFYVIILKFGGKSKKMMHSGLSGLPFLEWMNEDEGGWIGLRTLVIILYDNTSWKYWEPWWWRPLSNPLCTSQSRLSWYAPPDILIFWYLISWYAPPVTILLLSCFCYSKVNHTLMTERWQWQREPDQALCCPAWGLCRQLHADKKIFSN